MEDDQDSPEFPDWLDMSHFPEFDLRNALCQNYMVELIEAMHAQNTLVSGSLFSATKKFRYQREDGSFEIVDANPRTQPRGIGATSMIFQYIGDDDIPCRGPGEDRQELRPKTAFYKRLGFDAVTLHMSYRAQVPGQLLSPVQQPHRRVRRQL